MVHRVCYWGNNLGFRCQKFDRLFSNPPEAYYNRNIQSTDVLLSFHPLTENQSHFLRVVVDSNDILAAGSRSHICFTAVLPITNNQ